MALALSTLFAPIGLIPEQAHSAESTPIPSKRPETFYASPEMLKEIKRRMAVQNQPVYKAVKSKPHNKSYDVRVNEADADAILKHIRSMNLEQD